MTQDRVTIQQASININITRRTIYRWIGKGYLSVEKEGNRSYVSLADVRMLRNRMTTAKDTLSDDTEGIQQGIHKDTHIVTLDREHYEGLLVRLGQLESEKRYLLEYKAGLEAKDKELADTKENLNTQAQELATVKSILNTNTEELEKSRANLIETENELQRLLEIKRDAEAKLDSKDKEIEHTRATVAKANSELRKMLEIKQDAERKQSTLEQRERELAEIRAEVERLRLPWYKRLFLKK